MLGEDLSLSTEYFNALLRAAILEGEVYILTVERGGKKEIASWATFFPPGCALFETQVFLLTFISIPKLTKSLCSEAQRKLGFDEFFKKLKPEIQDWYTNTVCVHHRVTFDVVADWRRFYISVPEIYCRIHRQGIY